MRKLKMIEHMSLDGVIQSSAEDNFAYAEWTAPYRTPAGRDEVFAAHGDRFDLLLGRRTYDMWSGYWPTAPASAIGDSFNAATKYVVTHHPETLEWGPSKPLGPDFVDDVRRIKAEDGPSIILWGSSTLASTLLEHGLADEILFITYPVLLGAGKRFFKDSTSPRALDLVTSKALPSGVILTTYTVAGSLKNA